jgi:hypothetical protein
MDDVRAHPLCQLCQLRRRSRQRLGMLRQRQK